jgi:hypothetical protein
MWSAIGKELQGRADGIFRILARNERVNRQTVEKPGPKCAEVHEDFNSKEDNPGELVMVFENFS